MSSHAIVIVMRDYSIQENLLVLFDRINVLLTFHFTVALKAFAGCFLKHVL